MFMPQRSEFQLVEPVISLSQRRSLRDALSEREIEIAIGNLAEASRGVMADSDRSGWICLQVVPYAEHSVEKILADNDIEVWVPCTKPYEFVSRGRIKMMPSMPVVRGYVLVRCSLAIKAILGLQSVRDVLGIVGGTHSPWRARDEDVNQYRHLLEADEDQDEQDEVKNDPWPPGLAVHIVLGPFASFGGEIVQATKKRAKVIVRIFGRESEINIPLAHLRKL